METANEILISATQIKSGSPGESFEFIIGCNLNILDSIQVETIPQRKVNPIKNPSKVLDGKLFELNHVRVNPKVDNKKIIRLLIKKLKETGVAVTAPPDHNSVSLCFRPLGEIHSIVRFFINHKDELIFMSPSKPKLVCCS